MPSSSHLGAETTETGVPAESSRADSTPCYPRQAHPLAKGIFDLLKDAPAADRRHVLMTARGILFKRRPETVQLCINALAAAMSATGRISRWSYDRWRQDQDMPSEWPSSQRIADTFGSWSRAKDVAGADCVADVVARRLVTNGQALTRDEVLAGIELYANTGQPLTLRSYIAWARSEMQREDRAQDRFARSAPTINRIFGSWGRLLVEAGLSQRLADERRCGQEPSGRSEDYSLGQVQHWMTEAAPECGGRLMTMARYDKWAARRTNDALKEGQFLVIPRSATVLRHFNSWPDALAAAGLIAADEAIERRGRRGRFRSTAFLTECLARALRDLGPEPTCMEYREWRRQQRLSACPDSGLLPGDDTLMRRLGGWTEALRKAAALQSTQADQDPSPLDSDQNGAGHGNGAPPQSEGYAEP